LKKIIEQLNKIDVIYGFDNDKICPLDRNDIINIIEKTKQTLFPNYFATSTTINFEKNLYEIKGLLKKQIASSFCFVGLSNDGEEASSSFIENLPIIKEKLYKDISAIYMGDPAAKTLGEIAVCYPGFYAIFVYRLALLLYEMKIPLLPRIMTEHAHSVTGVDINAGANIGEHFFIDHGTGIVIGETTTIGNNVKLYQGVTLGAKSFELDEDGNPIKNIKRHPTIGNNVIIYANATILGGDTVIGENSIIGANVWLTHSVKDNSRVYYVKENKFK
jgi:serine O-acetyltransferase